MTKLIAKTIGYVEHLAPRGAYRTLCGRSVELASRRDARTVCEECATLDTFTDAELDREHAHVEGLAAVRVLADTADPVEGYDPIQRCDLCAAFDSDNAAARGVAIARFGTDADLTAVLYTDGQPFVLARKGVNR